MLSPGPDFVRTVVALHGRIIGTAVLEYGPAETLPPVGAQWNAWRVSADPVVKPAAQTRAESRVLNVRKQKRERDRLSAGGRRIRTLGPAPKLRLEDRSVRPFPADLGVVFLQVPLKFRREGELLSQPRAAMDAGRQPRIRLRTSVSRVVKSDTRETARPAGPAAQEAARCTAISDVLAERCPRQPTSAQ
jgi:hypothetical protein